MTALSHGVPTRFARPASRAEARIVSLHAELPAQWIHTETSPIHPRKGDVFLDDKGQLWRAVAAHHGHGHPSLVWEAADLVSTGTRWAVRSLAACAALSALGLFPLGPVLLAWVGPSWGWPLLIIAWLAMIAAVLTAAAAVEAQSRMVVITARHEPNHEHEARA